ncbi:MAG: iron chelate uptake ABC transporter family permease subunit [Dehalococcoidia bacterium]|nr:iron chelate uptake ABC transporter family permease subunit [Dehalococcoidia bacterium]
MDARRIEPAGAVAAPASRGAGLRRLAHLGPVAVCLLVLVAVALASLSQGAAGLPPRTVAGLLVDRLPLIAIELDVPETWRRIVFDVRLPRVIAAGAVGAALAYSGAAYQGVFRNPLAEPFLLGVASGAALGAALTIVSPIYSGAYGFGWVPAAAFAGGLLAMVLVYLFSRSGGSVSNATLILAGVALSAMLAAATSFILMTAGERTQAVLSFLFGGFNTASWSRVAWALPYLLAGSAVVAVFARVLNVLQLDEEQAAQLGVDVTRTKLLVLGGASLVAATAVAMAGVIGFVGLIVPHVVRILWGGDHRRLLPLAALLGASFLIAADLFARTVIAPQEVPVGIVTALLGGPFFLWLLRARRVGDL